MPSDKGRIIDQAKCAYSPLCKAFEKQIKTIEEQGKKQVGFSKVLKPNTQKLTTKNTISEKTWTEEAKNEFNESKEI